MYTSYTLPQVSHTLSPSGPVLSTHPGHVRNASPPGSQQYSRNNPQDQETDWIATCGERKRGRGGRIEALQIAAVH